MINFGSANILLNGSAFGRTSGGGSIEAEPSIDTAIKYVDDTADYIYEVGQVKLTLRMFDFSASGQDWQDGKVLQDFVDLEIIVDTGKYKILVPKVKLYIPSLDFGTNAQKPFSMMGVGFYDSNVGYTYKIIEI